MFDVDRILAIPDQSVDYLQMGISGGERAALAARGFIRADGIKAKDYMIRTIQKTAKNKAKAEKAIIKGDKKLSENSPVSENSQRKIGGLKADLNSVEGQIKYLETATKKQISSSRNNVTKTAYKELVAKRDALNVELAKALESDKQANAKSKIANSDAKKPVMTEDEYLSAKGAQFKANAAFHRNPRGVTKTLQKAKDDQARENEQISKVREALRSEYSEKVNRGEIRQPSRIESLVARAKGNSDNESVQAARRLLEKRGIDYKTVQFDKDGNVKPQTTSPDRTTTKSNRGLEVTYNKKGDLSTAAPDTAKKIKSAIAGVKGGKVVKGVSPRDREVRRLKGGLLYQNGKVVEYGEGRKFSQAERIKAVDIYIKELNDELKDLRGDRKKDIKLDINPITGERNKRSKSNFAGKEKELLARRKAFEAYIKPTKDYLKELEQYSKPKQPSATAKKLGISAEKEADILKRLKKY